MRRFGRKFWIFVMFSIYMFFSCSTYLGLRDDIFIQYRTPIEDERVLSIIKQAEEIVKPRVEIRYYSLETFSERHPGWQMFINGFYKISGIWPFDSFEKIIITDVALERLSDKQLLFIIGHELGHARADHNWRGKGFLFANKNLFYSLAAFFRPREMNQRLLDEHIKSESVADEAGIECVGPEDALKFLELLQWVSILGGTPTIVVEGRINLIEEKYNLN